MSALYKNKDGLLTDRDPADFLNVPNMDSYKLDYNTARKVDAKLSLEELKSFLDRSDKFSSPGYSGIGYGFLDEFWDFMGSPILACANHSFRQGILPDFLRRGVLRLIPKEGKDRRRVKNWRPIALQEAIYKLISGALSDRLNLALDKIIHRSQTGFIPGRSMNDNVRTIYNTVEIAKAMGRRGILVSIDFTKAFDSISHRYLKKALLFFGFPRNFRKWIDVILNSFHVEILHAGFLLDPFVLSSGIRQGDPPAPGLFVLGVEILLIKIRLCPEIRKFRIDNIVPGVIGYADDLNCLLECDRNSLIKLFEILDEFYMISGLKANMSKTNCLYFGRPPPEHNNTILYPDLDLVWVDRIKLLGVTIDHALEEISVNNFDPKLKAIKGTTSLWTYRFLSEFGRKIITNSLCLPKISFLAALLPKIEQNKKNELKNGFFQTYIG